MRQRLKVWPYANPDGSGRELARFYVESQRPDIEPYLVDLLSMQCNGCCPCEHFIRRIMKKVATLFLMPWQRRPVLMCIHLHDAREYFLQECLHKIQAIENQHRENKIVVGSPNTKNYE